MNFSIIEKADPLKDTVIAFGKDNLDAERIEELTGASNVKFDAEHQEVKIVYDKSGSTLFLLGLGEAKQSALVHAAFRSLGHNNRKYFGDTVQLDASNLSANQLHQAVLGLKMADYEIGFMKSDQNSTSQVSCEIVTDTSNQTLIEEAEKTADTINRIKELVDSPADRKTPEFLANWAVESGNNFGYDVKIWDKSNLEEEGFGAVLAVGRGSIHEPRLIRQTWNPEGTDTPDLVLVGKGITFDTGGLSIKPSNNLHYMKSDMGGAAAVLGALELVARLGIKKHIVGVVASAENAVDGKSYRPGDVIPSYSRKNIEIIDTDAEGRLVLADAISYSVRNLKPKQMIDLATLTGSVVRALGYSAAGLFTENDQMAAGLSEVGEEIRERVWRMPMYEEFEEELQSDIADIRNLSMKPVGGSINAAKFLEAFTEDHPAWTHLDIAGVAFGDSPYAKLKCASGFGVRLLIEYIRKQS